MNTAIQLKQEKTLRDLYMYSDRYRGPEAYILANNHAWEIGKAIAENGDNLYLRAQAAVIKATEILLKGYESKDLGLTVKQLETLQDINKKLTALPDEEDKFVEWAVKEYRDIVPNFSMKNYGF